MKIGILGGIGIEASSYFYGELIKRLQKTGLIRCNTDYPQIVINSIPAPELHLEEHDKPEILGAYINGIRDLQKHEPDFIVMVCNTIHVFLNKIQAATGAHNILPLPLVVKDALSGSKNDVLCVLGTGLTISRGLYDFPDFKYVTLDQKQQEDLCEIVVDYNSGGNEGQRLQKNKDGLLLIVESCRAQGATTFLLACTEISELLGREPIKKLDTLELLIDETVGRIVDSIKKSLKT